MKVAVLSPLESGKIVEIASLVSNVPRRWASGFIAVGMGRRREKCPFDSPTLYVDFILIFKLRTVHFKPRWLIVRVGARSRGSYGKVEDYEQSSFISDLFSEIECTHYKHRRPNGFFVKKKSLYMTIIRYSFLRSNHD